MMKSDIDIKDDIYKHIKGSALEKAVTGKLCKASKRPANSNKEDIIISILDNGSGQMQEAFVNVNIYVKDNIRDGEAEICGAGNSAKSPFRFWKQGVEKATASPLINKGCLR